MSDPFDRLRDADASEFVPDVSAIKSRARSIERRRHLGVAGGAAALIVVAMIGMITTTGDDNRVDSLAQRETTDESADATESVAGAPADATSKAKKAGKPAAAVGRTTSGSSAVSEMQSGDAAAKGSDPAQPQPTLKIDVTERPRGADFTLTACNPTSETMEQTFPTAQEYDFVVKQEGEVIWRWSDGMVFTQNVHKESWKPKECKRWATSWDGQRSSDTLAAPGSYEVTGVLKTSAEQKTKPEPFCLDVC